ncbi:hypothetical protein [Kluyvera ascorbata]|uniref:hypothetical protein n=2 Tax=Kluyvera TaxID=579 RepID=UPI0029135873|nr:hypothetical protein [Kluyvera ascorbata]MDU3911562.1 hypothetical protein [Kluyvera ascorbata]
MKEEIIKSKDSMGELTAALTEKEQELRNLQTNLTEKEKELRNLKTDLKRVLDKNSLLDKEVAQLTTDNLKLNEKYGSLHTKAVKLEETINNYQNTINGGWIGRTGKLAGIGLDGLQGVASTDDTVAGKALGRLNSLLNDPNGSKKN